MEACDRTLDRSRRAFLKMVSKAGIAGAMASPLVSGLMYTRAARAAGEVKRAVFVYTPDGAPNGLWLPSGTTLNVATKAYEGLQSLCNFREVEVLESGHGLSQKSLGSVRFNPDWTGDTVDQQIASVLSLNTPYQSYMLGVQANPAEGVSRKSGDSVPMQNSPAAAYQQLFGSAPPVADVPDFLLRKKSVMDINKGALDQLKGRLGAFERETLEKHEVALGKIETRLTAATSGEVAEGCDSPAWNANGYDTQGPVEGGEVGIFRYQAELQSDIISAAFQCGLTNVMTLQLGWHQAVWYGHNTNYAGDHHGSCHAAPAEDNAEMTDYLSGCVAYLVDRLANADDPAAPGSKLIDNTIVVQVTDMGDGQDHSAGDGPNMIATRLPGFKQGTVGRGGNNREVLEAVVEGLGLGAYKGTDASVHKIWPHADGSIADDLLA
ncbi:MAG: DUF1552 domain-containing protein [Myxococcota bacterium]